MWATESEEDGDDRVGGAGGGKEGGHGSDSAEDYTDDEDEGEDGYKVGGYHPVKVGEVYNQRLVHAQCLIVMFIIWCAYRVCCDSMIGHGLKPIISCLSSFTQIRSH